MVVDEMEPMAKFQVNFFQPVKDYLKILITLALENSINMPQLDDVLKNIFETNDIVSLGSRLVRVDRGHGCL